MQTKFLLSALSSLALVSAQAQGPAPPASTLSTTQSGVLPILPTNTPFTGLETIEGAITYDGPMIDGFTGPDSILSCRYGSLANVGLTGPGGNATIQNNNPAATYQAVLPNYNFDNATGSTITGMITGAASSNGTGVMFTINFSGFPSESEYGPFGKYSSLDHLESMY